MSKDIDQIMNTFNKLPNELQDVEQVELEKLVEYYEKKGKYGLKLNIFRHFLAFLMGLCLLPYMRNDLGFYCLSFAILIYVYYATSDVKFQIKLEKQDYSASTTSFISYRKEEMSKALNDFMKGRYIITPLLVIMSINNLVVYSKKLEGPWILLVALLSIVPTIYIIYWIQASIKEYQEKIKALD
jgi:hypothetical protein